MKKWLVPSIVVIVALALSVLVYLVFWTSRVLVVDRFEGYRVNQTTQEKASLAEILTDVGLYDEGLWVEHSGIRKQVKPWILRVEVTDKPQDVLLVYDPSTNLTISSYSMDWQPVLRIYTLRVQVDVKHAGGSVDEMARRVNYSLLRALYRQTGRYILGDGEALREIDAKVSGWFDTFGKDWRFIRMREGNGLLGSLLRVVTPAYAVYCGTGDVECGQTTTRYGCSIPNNQGGYIICSDPYDDSPCKCPYPGKECDGKTFDHGDCVWVNSGCFNGANMGNYGITCQNYTAPSCSSNPCPTNTSTANCLFAKSCTGGVLETINEWANE